MSHRDAYIGRPLSRLASPNGGIKIDSADVRSHLESLLAIDMTPNMIARAAGVSGDTVLSIVRQEWSTVRPSVADALMQVTPRPSRHQVLVLSYGARRRVEGLSVMGWSIRRLREESGLGYETLRSTRNSSQIRWRVHETVVELFDRLGHVDGGDIRTKSWAERQGFVHPMLWDDIDEWSAKPAAPKRMNSHEYRMEEIDFLRGMGLSDEGVAGRLGITLFSLQQWERRYRVVAA